jgi:hypothetical protein
LDLAALQNQFSLVQNPAPGFSVAPVCRNDTIVRRGAARRKAFRKDEVVQLEFDTGSHLKNPCRPKSINGHRLPESCRRNENPTGPAQRKLARRGNVNDGAGKGVLKGYHIALSSVGLGCDERRPERSGATVEMACHQKISGNATWHRRNDDNSQEK